MGSGQAAHHLERLVSEGLLRVQHQGNRHHYFDIDFPEEAEPLIGAMQSGARRAILVALARKGDLSFARLAKESGEPKHAVAWHLRTLLARGLVEKVPRAPSHVYRVPKSDLVLRVSRMYLEPSEARVTDSVASLLGGLMKE